MNRALRKLTGYQLEKAGAQMIILRVARGVKSHFNIRLSEWIMVYPAVGLGMALNYQQDMFEQSLSFQVLKSWGNETTWAVFVLMSGLIRLFALVVNGTFKNFRFSPHLRLLAAFAGVTFWSQFCLGFLLSALAGQGAWSAPIAYSTLVILELANIYRTWTDVVRNSSG